MKPLGISLDMRVVKPTRAQDAIWEAVEEAISNGMTPEQFIREARQAWAYERAEAAKSDDNTFAKANNP